MLTRLLDSASSNFPTSSAADPEPVSLRGKVDGMLFSSVFTPWKIKVGVGLCGFVSICCWLVWLCINMLSRADRPVHYCFSWVNSDPGSARSQVAVGVQTSVAGPLATNTSRLSLHKVFENNRPDAGLFCSDLSLCLICLRGLISRDK